VPGVAPHPHARRIYTNPQAPVTYDHCTAGLVFRIDAGNYGSVSLDGLKFALVLQLSIYSPRIVHFCSGITHLT
jgi:hypothetical protein